MYVRNVVGLGYSSAQASCNVAAVYGELYAPQLKNLEFTAALRDDNYTDYGSIWAAKRVRGMLRVSAGAGDRWTRSRPDRLQPDFHNCTVASFRRST